MFLAIDDNHIIAVGIIAPNITIIIAIIAITKTFSFL